MNSTKLNSMPALPAMPKAYKAKATRECKCGCGNLTQRTWYPGHDGRATGWAIRIERNIIKLEDVPASERQGAEWMLGERKIRAAQRKEAKAS